MIVAKIVLSNNIDVCVHYLGVFCFKQTTESLGQGNKFYVRCCSVMSRTESCTRKLTNQSVN